MSKWVLVNELHSPARKHFLRRKYKQIGILDTYQIDLIDIQPYAKENAGNKYILIAIDVFTKFCYAIPLKSKSGIDTTEGMKKIFLKHNKQPKKIQSDNGTEFYNKYFKKLLSDYNIHLYSTYSDKKASIVERVIRTIKTNLWKLFSFRGTYKYIDILDSVIDTYNNTIHRTIKMKPSDVNTDNEKLLLDTVYNYKYSKTEKQKFFVNDFCRISKYKAQFQKSYKTNWSFEIFQIIMVKNCRPIQYVLRDYEDNIIQGGFYQFELLKVADPSVYLVKKIIKRKKNKLLVEFLGFKKHEWIDDTDIVE